MQRALRSAYAQDFDSFEIVVVSDASRGKDKRGRNAKKIVKAAQKEAGRLRKQKGLSPVAINFLEFSQNRGLIEVRRALCQNARGLYITQLDSDDELAPEALKALYEAAVESGADIVHGTSVAGVFDAEGNFCPSEENRYGAIFYGKITGREVFRNWLVNGAFTANTWGKLIKRSIWQCSFEKIPYTECNMADDALLFFFLAQASACYVGIEAQVYRYRVNTGMTSARKIDSLEKWQKICSTASVFTIISQWIEEKNSDGERGFGASVGVDASGDSFVLLSDEVDKIRKMAVFYLANNLRQLSDAVVPQLKEDAYQMLCDYWGAHFVDSVDAAMKAQAQKSDCQ